MVKVPTFGEAIEDSKDADRRHLLLGNGFSIACDTRFGYTSLLEAADFDNVSELPELFEVCGTEDFEQVMRLLDNTLKVLEIYKSPGAGKINTELEALKDILIRTIIKKHPSNLHGFDPKKLEACWKFLSHFIERSNKGCNVYTLNYDLLLYWALRKSRDSETIKLRYRDGFGNGGDMPVVWRNKDNTNIHYLHGALHLFYDGSDLHKHKYDWNSGHSILLQVRDGISSGKFPLFVAEGESEQKLSKIRSNWYLFNSYESFSRAMEQKQDALFIFGHSLDETDDHILDCIVEGKISRVYVSLYHDPESGYDQNIIKKAKQWETFRHAQCPLKVKFFDAESAKVWG